MSSRLAQPQDAEAIESVRVQAWSSAYRDFMPAAFLEALDPKANVSALRARLAGGSDNLITRVVESEGTVVAFSLLGVPRYDAPDGTVELWAINVLPSHWRRRFGALLVDASVEDARALTASFLELWCIDGNIPAQLLYERSGFVKTTASRTTSRLTGNPLHEVQYRLAL